jgi:hypothetical protein
MRTHVAMRQRVRYRRLRAIVIGSAALLVLGAAGYLIAESPTEGAGRELGEH